MVRCTHNLKTRTMAREKSFTFIPAAQLNPIRVSKPKFTATVDGRYGYIRFSSDYVREHNMSGKPLKFYADKSKKAVGWRVIDNGGLSELSGCKMVYLEKKNKAGKMVPVLSVGIGSILNTIGVKGKIFKKVNIEHYKESGLLSNEYDYVELS